MVLNLLGGLLGGAGQQSSSTSINPLWDLQAQYLPGTFQAATDIYNRGAPGFYPGQSVAGFDPVRAQGTNLAVDAALGPQQQLAGQQSDFLSGILGGTDQATSTLAQQAAQATGGAFGQSGTFGSARHAQAANNAATQQILDRQFDAADRVAGAQQTALAPAQTLTQAGRSFQDYQQDLLDADKQRYDYQANLPFNWLQQYQSALAPAGISAPTSTTQQQGGGIGGFLSGLFGAEGGEVPGYADGGQVPTEQIGQGIYSDVPNSTYYLCWFKLATPSV